jgi:hypothetical protein
VPGFERPNDDGLIRFDQCAGENRPRRLPEQFVAVWCKRLAQPTRQRTQAVRGCGKGKARSRETGILLFYATRGKSAWQGTHGNHLCTQFRKAWKAAREAAEKSDALFHDFRRTAVRNMIRAGVDRKVAMMISGHKTESVFERYNITDDRDLEDAMRKTQAYIAQLPKERENPTQIEDDGDEGHSH